jgi:gamma-glutamylcyclotransferase
MSGDTPQLYFAYGANMSASQLARRLRRADLSAFQRRPAMLPGYRLAFNKVSSTDPAIGYANIIPDPHDTAEGVLYEMPVDCLEQLDRIELVPSHYIRSTIPVMDVRDGRYVEAHVYVANPTIVRRGLRPDPAYIKLLLEGSDLLSPSYRQRLAAAAGPAFASQRQPDPPAGSCAWP